MLGTPEQRRGHLNHLLESWRGEWTRSGADAQIEHRAQPDARGDFHWLLRLAGEEKDVITIWLRLAQRRVHLECELVPAPEENREELYRYLLARNARMSRVHAALGPEDGLYLVASRELEELSEGVLDELVAATLTYVEEIYPTAMSLAHPRWYRRRPVR